MRYSLNFNRGLYRRLYRLVYVSMIGVMKGDTRSLAYSLYIYTHTHIYIYKHICTECDKIKGLACEWYSHYLPWRLPPATTPQVVAGMTPAFDSATSTIIRTGQISHPPHIAPL